MTRTRVLICLWRLSRSGGIPVVVRGFLEHFDRDAFDVHVCTVRPIRPEDEVDRLGPGIRYHPLDLSGPGRASLRLRALAGFTATARRVRPHVLHLHSGTAVYGALTPLVAPGASRLIEVHDAPQEGRMSRPARLVERVLARRFGFRPIVHSAAVREATAAAWGVAPESIPVVPLGIDVDAYVPDPVRGAEFRAELGLGPDDLLVSYVARVVPEKRPELFIEVARRVTARLPRARFALVGGGSGVTAARREVERLGLRDRITVTGFVEDLLGVYAASDVFVSTSRYEGFGLAVAEAMATGLPVVSTRVGGVEDVIGDAGVLEADDPESLARRVVELLEDEGARARLGAEARRRAERALDVRDTARAFEACYRDPETGP